MEVLVAAPLPSLASTSSDGCRAKFRVGAVQLAWTAVAEELVRRIEEGVARAAAAGAQLVCLQELSLSPYFCSSPPAPDRESPFAHWMRPEDCESGPTMLLITRLARTYGVFVHASLFERMASPSKAAEGIERGFNTAICVAPDGTLISKTRKVHIPVTAGYREDLFFNSSDAKAAAGPVVTVARTARVGFPTCWDQWNTELSRCYALEGADVLCYATAIGSEPDHPTFDTRPSWQAVMVGQAVASGLFVVAVNRVGTEDMGGAVPAPITFYGSSFICDPYGRVLVQAPRDRPAVIVAELDITARRDWLTLFPLLATRRPELYGALTLPFHVEVEPAALPSAALLDPARSSEHHGLTTPARDGYVMPAEWEPHEQTWMVWPEREDNWRSCAKYAQEAFVRVALAIAAFEPVSMCASRGQYATARAALPPSIRVVEMSSNDAWMRDIGPTFVVPQHRRHGCSGRPRAVKWIFNAWGGKTGGLYDCWDDDLFVAQKVSSLERALCYEAPLVLEGGSIHVDGEGTCLVTEECLLNPNRRGDDPGGALDRAGVEAALKSYLGVSVVVWLGRGVPGDETSGHVDNLAAWAAPGIVLLTWTDDESDPLHAVCVDAEARLLAARDARGRRLSVTRLHAPSPPLVMEADEVPGAASAAPGLHRRAGMRLAASYVNFYVCNGGVVAPVFGGTASRSDAEALRVLAAAFPGRRVVGVPARDILLGGGNIHCITQQQPA